MSIVKVNTNSKVPKYKQIVNSLEDAIKKGQLKKGDKLPSLNRVKNQFGLSRDTVITAFNDLKQRGIIESTVGKGYYVLNDEIQNKHRIFLLFDELNAFKEDLYKAFAAQFGTAAHIDLYFHHFNIKVLQSLIRENTGNYTAYVIMPANLKGLASLLKILPQDKVYILDQTQPELNHYPAVYQNFETDVFNALSEAKALIRPYHQFILKFNENTQPIGILKGFQTFCQHNLVPFQIINASEDLPLLRGALYLVLEDQHLIKLIKRMKDHDLVLAKDMGIISYNDTLLKEIVEGGITTISTDFKAMGTQLAQMILKEEPAQIENTNQLILRSSL